MRIALFASFYENTVVKKHLVVSIPRFFQHCLIYGFVRFVATRDSSLQRTKRLWFIKCL